MEEKAIRLSLTGLVQGVGFRAFLADEAARHGLIGWVRNRRDRSVEAVLAGPADAVGEVVLACRRGPPGSWVEHVEITEAEVGALRESYPGASFSVLPTA